MPVLKRTQNTLFRNGYVPKHQSEMEEIWIDATQGGTPISFRVRSKHVIGRYCIHGATPDRPEFDEFTSTWSGCLLEAIRFARA